VVLTLDGVDIPDEAGKRVLERGELFSESFDPPYVYALF